MLNLFLKTLRDKKVFIIGWSLGLAFLGFAMVTFYPSFSGGEMDDLLRDLQPILQGFIGELQDWRQLPGYIGSQIFDIRLPIIIGVLAILLAVGLSVAEEDKGQLRTIVALPISRTKIVLTKWVFIVAVCLVASIATIIGVLLGVLVIGEEVGLGVLLRLGFMTWLLSTALASIIFAFGIATGFVGTTKAVGTIIAAGSFMLTTFAQSVSWLQNYEWLSIFHYFPATTVAKEGIAGTDVLILLALTAISLAVAIIFFRRRDIKDT